MDLYRVVKNPGEKKGEKERKKGRRMDEYASTMQRHKHARLIYPTNRPIPRDGRATDGVNAERVSAMHGRK